MMFEVRDDDLSGALALHRAGMYAASPPGTVFALDLTGLQAPDIRMWTAWTGDRVVMVGALGMLADGGGEVKSMRTHPDFARRGAGTALLDTIIAAATAHGATRLSLETGSGPVFEPALALYRRRGFVDGPAFADYRSSAFNRFLHLDLRQPAPAR